MAEPKVLHEWVVEERTNQVISEDGVLFWRYRWQGAQEGRWIKYAENDAVRAIARLARRVEGLRGALEALANDSEALVGADPDLANYRETERRFDDSLEQARAALREGE